MHKRLLINEYKYPIKIKQITNINPKLIKFLSVSKVKSCTSPSENLLKRFLEDAAAGSRVSEVVAKP